MTNVCLWDSQRFDVTLIHTSMRDLETSFGCTRIANNRILDLAGITRLPVPSTSKRDPSLVLKLGVMCSLPIARKGRHAAHGQ